MRIACPLGSAFGAAQADIEELSYAERLRALIATVHDFAQDHQQSGSQRMKRRYDICSEAFTFRKGGLMWLYNPQHKKGKSPKLSPPWEGTYVVVECLNDVVYRIQRGPQTKPKVVHRDCLWQYCGDACADWFNDPPEGQGANLPEGESTRQEVLEDTTRSNAASHRTWRRRCKPPDSDGMFLLPVMKPIHCREARTTSGVQTGVGEDPSDIVTLRRDAMFRERGIVLLRNSLRTLSPLLFFSLSCCCMFTYPGWIII